jgi:L-malate glycosyltransferase
MSKTPSPRGSGGRLRIAIIAASLKYVGGQSVQADLLLRNWQNDPAVDVSFIPIDPPFPRFLRWAGRVPGLRTLLRQPLYIRALWRGLRESDIAHIFSASYLSFLVAPAFAWIVARMRGKKTVIHYHSGEARDHLRRSRIAREILARVDRLIVPSGYLVDVFREFGLKAEPVPNIVDFSQFMFRVREPVRAHLVCTRGFHPYYAVDVVVRAFAEVKREYPEAQLDLHGSGPTEKQVRELVQQLKLSGVNFAGVASREEIGRCYDQADIFINASCLDNMPVSILEAYACGTPVVSTAPEGLDYVVEHGRTGLLSPVGDAHALAQNVIRVLRDAELAKGLALNGFQELEKYRWPTVRKQWLDAYRAVVVARDEPARELIGTAR